MAVLSEVAASAKVSVATASRVLNGSAHPVSGEVRRRVEKAAAKLGYRPSAAAQSLKAKKSRIVGVIVGDIVDPYFAEMARGIEMEAAEHGYITVVSNANRDPELEFRQFKVLREHRAAGIVFCGSDIVGAPGTEQLVREVNAATREGAKVIALAPRSFESVKMVVDNYKASFELTQYLLELGHRSIAFNGGIPGLASGEMRVRAYADAMKQAGCEPLIVGQERMDQLSGQQAVRALLDSKTQVDAIICSNDEVAIGSLATLWSAGVQVPGDISVAGIGGTRGGEVFDLTTMKLPLVRLGELAARSIADKDFSSTALQLPEHELLVRGTTARKA